MLWFFAILFHNHFLIDFAFFRVSRTDFSLTFSLTTLRFFASLFASLMRPSPLRACPKHSFLCFQNSTFLIISLTTLRFFASLFASLTRPSPLRACPKHRFLCFQNSTFPNRFLVGWLRIFASPRYTFSLVCHFRSPCVHS